MMFPPQPTKRRVCLGAIHVLQPSFWNDLNLKSTSSAGGVYCLTSLTWTKVWLWQLVADPGWEDTVLLCPEVTGGSRLLLPLLDLRPPPPPPALLDDVQVWSLTQFYSVDFSQSRIGVNKCVFWKRTIKVCITCCWRCPGTSAPSVAHLTVSLQNHCKKIELVARSGW